jgi:hypothetical protein
MNPGMMLRVDEYSVNAFKSVFQRELPDNIVSVFNLPDEYHYKYSSYLPGCSWSVDYEDIEYTDLDLRLEDITFELTRMDGMWGEILMDMPALKYWAISATQDFHHWYYPSKSEIIVYIEDFDVDFGFDLKLDEKGYLDPVVWDVVINYGDSYVWHDNWYVQYTMHQFLALSKVMV